jgi:hypothetical protein
MKKLLFTLLSFGTICSSQAQLFTSEGLTGAAFGGILGSIIGHNSGRHGAEGAAIGAGAGFLLGSLAHQANRESYYYSSYGYADPSYGYYGYRSGYGYPGYYVYRNPQTYVAPQPAPVQNITINHNYYNTSTPMSSANALFGR